MLASQPRSVYRAEMVVVRTAAIALLLCILTLAVLVAVGMSLALVVLLLARTNPVLGFVGLVFGVGLYRVATGWKPKWFLE